MSTSELAPSEQAPSKSFPARFIGVFLSPGETFADIARKPDFIAPLIVIIIAAVAFTETMLAKIGMERIVRQSMEQSSRTQNMTPEQMQQAVSQGVKIGGIITHVAGLIGPPIYLLVIAGIGLLIVNAILGGQAKFKSVFSAVCYAYSPALLGTVMGIALILFGDPENFNAQNPVPTNVGFFLNWRETSKPLMAIASSFDVFTIWFVLLAGIGLSATTERKAKASTVSIIYFGLWIVWVLGKAGLSMLTG